VKKGKVAQSETGDSPEREQSGLEFILNFTVRFIIYLHSERYYDRCTGNEMEGNLQK
jgi:hypothetical protein